MLALIITLHLAALGDQSDVHLLPELSRPPMPSDLASPLEVRGMERRVYELSLRINRLPTSIGSGTVVLSALGYAGGGLSLMTGLLTLLVSALMPSGGLPLLLIGIGFTVAGIFLVGIASVVLIMGKNTIDEYSDERKKLLDERNQLERNLRSIRGPLSSIPTNSAELTIARF